MYKLSLFAFIIPLFLGVTGAHAQYDPSCKWEHNGCFCNGIWLPGHCPPPEESGSTPPSGPSGTISVPGEDPVDLSDPLSIAEGAVNSYIVDVPAGDTLSVRARPHHQARRLFRVRDGANVRGGQPQRQSNGSRWTGICVQDQCGWANSRYLTPGSGNDSGNAGTLHVVNVASNDVLNIRSRPSASSSRVGSIPARGRGIQYLDDARTNGSTTWILIRYRNVTGWVNARYVSR